MLSHYTWTQDLRMFLIRSVEPKEKLWKKYPQPMNDLEIRLALWSEVQREIEQAHNIRPEIEDIKKTWKNLKDNYVRNKKMINAEPGRGSKWFFFEALQFLERATDIDVTSDGVLSERSTGASRKRKSAHSPGIDITVTVKEMNCAKRRLGPFDQLFSVPEIEKQLDTKQQGASCAIPLPMDIDLAKLAELTRDLWANCVGEVTATDHSEENESTSAPSPVACSSTSGASSIGSEFEALDMPLSPNGKLDELTKQMLYSRIHHMRGEFQRIIMTYFLGEGLREGTLASVLKEYDEFVYNQEKRTDGLDDVLSTCTERERSEFEKMFEIVASHRDQLELLCPSIRMGKFENAENRGPIKSLTGDAKLLKSRLTALLKSIKHRRMLIAVSRHETEREIKRITMEMSSQPSVIRKTQLKEQLERAKETMDKLAEEETDVQQKFESIVGDIDQSAIYDCATEQMSLPSMNNETMAVA